MYLLWFFHFFFLESNTRSREMRPCDCYKTRRRSTEKNHNYREKERELWVYASGKSSDFFWKTTYF